jgi:hypothetical protein
MTRPQPLRLTIGPNDDAIPSVEAQRLADALNGLLGQRLWAYLEAQPGFTEGLERSEAELAAGGGVLYEVRGDRLVKARRKR